MTGMTRWGWAAGVVTIMSSVAVAAPEFSGSFEGADLSVQIKPEGGKYRGEIRRHGERYPLEASDEAGTLRGTFTSGGEKFEFTATMKDGSLTLVTGGTTYSLKRLAPAGNPLARPKAGNPLAHATTAPAGGDAPAGYAVVTSTDSGKAMSSSKPKVTSVRAALASALGDLGKYFDAKPKVSGAYEDMKDRRSGGASFSATLKGKQVKGFASCTLTEQGATVAVVYGSADAPPEEWRKLLAGGGGAANVPLKEYQFPDGTGSVGLAEGWKTNAQSCLSGVVIQGPADQQVSIGITASVVTPDSPLVQTQRQLEANARALGTPPPPPPQVFVAPFTGPADALTNLVPQISRFSQRAGGPLIKLDQITDKQDVKPNLPNGKAALLRYAVTRVTKGNPKEYRALARIETTPLGPGAWMFYAVELAGPKETFDKDLPVMLAMTNSFKTNDEVVQARTRQNLDAQNRRFAALQQAHRDQVEAFDRYNKAWERRSTEQSRSAADFDEVIRGYRTVEDTRTGDRTSVDLGNAHDIVEKLNEADPGRYKEIPLRDELYPLPEGK